MPTDKLDEELRQNYAKFIGQIELRNVWIREAEMENLLGSISPDQAAFSLKDEASYESTSVGFTAFHTYTMIAEEGGDVACNLRVTFALDFSSSVPITDNYFDLFKRANLPVNTWPFLREFAFTTFGRFGWAPITLPTLKVGTENISKKRRRKPARPSE